MLPVPEQYVSFPCEIKLMNGDPILYGCISRIADDEMEISGKDGRLPIVHCNTIVKLNLYHRTLGFKALVGKVYLSTETLIRVVNLQLAADYEKRNFFRVRACLECSIMPVSKNGGGNNGNRRFYPAVTENLSLGGLLFSCGEKLEAGEALIVCLKLYSAALSLPCKIIRRSGGPGTQWKYGCEFLDNTGRQFDVICRYLFDCQRDQICMIKQKQS